MEVSEVCPAGTVEVGVSPAVGAQPDSKMTEVSNKWRILVNRVICSFKILPDYTSVDG